MKLSAIVTVFICSSAFAQKNSYQNLIDTALKGHGSLFFYSKPLTITGLDAKEMWFYVENLRQYSTQPIDTAILFQIIQNSKNVDTTQWTDNELPYSLLLKDRSEIVSKKYIIKKYNLAHKKQISHLVKYINKFNSAPESERMISYYSRPVFDNSKKFAIVEWDNGHGYLYGGGGIILYQLQSDKTWKEFGSLQNWRH